MSHTPGPWAFAHLESGAICVYAGTWHRICQLAKRGDQTVPNAALLCAAPEMLAALKEIRDHLYQPQDRDRARDLANAAISKAEGRA